MKEMQCHGEIRETGTAKGRGVFSTRAFAAGDLVESCPVVLVNPEDFDAVPEPIRRLLFNWSALTGSGSGMNALALGYGSLYNHGKPANLRYFAAAADSTLVFVADRPIALGEELTANYNAGYGAADSNDDTWFDGEGLTAL